MKLLISLLTFSFFGFTTQPVIKKATVHTVRMEGMKFVPKVLELNAGDKVVWINDTNTSHNVVAGSGSFRSAMLYERGMAYEYTFTTAGSYNYHCQPHKIMGMKGTIIVH